MTTVRTVWWRVPAVLRGALIFLACYLCSVFIGFSSNTIGLLNAMLIAALLIGWIMSEKHHYLGHY